MNIIQSGLDLIGLREEGITDRFDPSVSYWDKAKNIGTSLCKPIFVAIAVIKIGIYGATNKNLYELGMATAGGASGVAMVALTTFGPVPDPKVISCGITAGLVVVGLGYCAVQGVRQGLRHTKQHLGLKVAIYACVTVAIAYIGKKFVAKTIELN